MDAAADGVAIAERLVPTEFAAVAVLPSPARHRLDRLRRDLALAAYVQQRLDVGRILPDIQHREVVGKQDGIEGEALEAAAMHRGDLRAVAGYADEAHEALAARFDQSLER